MNNEDMRFSFSVDNPEMEKELSRWNWGAFLLTFIWGLYYKVWWSLLVLIPIFPLPLIIAIILGVQGNKLALNSQKYSSLDELKNSQKRWAYSGLVVFIIIVVAMVLFIFYLTSWYKKESGASLSQTFQVVTLQKDIEKLSSGALIIKKDTGSFPKNMSEIINSKNFKVILSLEGLREIPKDSSGQKIRYCLYKNEVYFVYYLDKTSTKPEFITTESLIDSIAEEELKKYSCVQD